VFFDGRLPKYRVHRRQPHGREHGFIDNTAATIWICASPDPRKTCCMKCVTSARLGMADSSGRNCDASPALERPGHRLNAYTIFMRRSE